ncbi:MAG: queuosine precursor transporter [Anaerolineales bacterium]
MQAQKSFRFFDLIMALFVTVLIVSNIASSAKIVDWGMSIFGLPLAFDAGTLLFPVSYIFGDVLTEVYGYRRSRRVIWAGFFALALTAGTFALVRAMPGEATWQNYAGDAAYEAILGGMSTGGIVLASLAAYWSGEFLNSFVLAKLKVATAGRWLWMRTIGSTLAGQAVDTAVFILIATLAGVFPWELFTTLVVSNYLFKVGIEALMTPFTYTVVAALKRAEHEDYYDRETDFNPFAMS